MADSRGEFHAGKRTERVTRRLAQRAVNPPSISNVAPLMSAAAGDARNTTAPHTSAGSPTRPSGILHKRSLRKASFSSHFTVPGVRMKVGATALTFTWCGPHSTAKHLVKCAIAALVMQYTDSVGKPTKPA